MSEVGRRIGSSPDPDIAARSEATGGAERFAVLNPFQSLPQGAGSHAVSVDTPAITSALRYLNDYLDDEPRVHSPTDRGGYILAVAGEFGSGRTHLVERIVERCRSVDAAATDRQRGVRSVYLDAATLMLHEFHRRFVERIPRGEVVERVRGYYADVVIDQIADVKLADNARSVLGHARVTTGEIDSYASALGLSQALSLDRLRTRMAGLLGSDAYARAFTLLLRDGLDDAAWEWIQGGDPHPALVERGMPSSASGQTSALDVIGIFALLYGHRGYKFVLLIDELDKVLSSSTESGRTQALLVDLRTLFGDLAQARTLTFVIGLPDSFDFLEPDLQYRMNSIIRMRPFDEETATEFVRKSLRRVHGRREDRLDPFTPATIRAIVEFTRGNPRRVIGLCQRVYRAAREAGTAVTPAMVRSEARDRFATSDKPWVGSAIRQVLESYSWSFVSDYFVSEAGIRVDFWIPLSGDDHVGCAVLIIDVLVDQQDVTRLFETADQLRRTSMQIETLVVVAVRLGDVEAAHLKDAFGRDPLVFRPHSFGEEFAAALKNVLHGLEGSPGGDPLTGLRDHVKRLHNEQAKTSELIARMSSAIDDMRGDIDGAFKSVQRDIADAARGPGVGAERAGSFAMPRRVEMVFATVLRGLDSLGGVDVMFKDAFEFTSSASEPAVSRIGQVFFEPAPLLQGLGSQAVVRAVVEGFRESIRSWYREFGPTQDELLGVTERRALDVACGRYRKIHGLLRMADLDELRPVSGYPTASNAQPSTDEVRSQLDGLSGTVRDEILGQFSGRPAVEQIRTDQE